MAIRRLNCVHTPAEDRQRPIGGRGGQAVAGFATFYLPDSGWQKIPPGALDLAELWGGASGIGNQDFNLLGLGPNLERTGVQFYLDLATRNHPNRIRGYVGVNGSIGELFTFGFFGRKYS